MPYAEINGINIHYEVRGGGPPLLMMAPGGFDSTIEKWTTSGIWESMKPLETLTSRYTCVAYDRREAGLSGGKVERISWTTYAHEAKGLLDILGINAAFVMGGCMGCSTATAFGVAYPESTLGLVLHWPVGGVHWRQNGLDRFQAHVNFVKDNGLAAVVDLAREKAVLLGRTQGWPLGLHHRGRRGLRREFCLPEPGAVSGYGGADGPNSIRPGHGHRPRTSGTAGPAGAFGNHPRGRRRPRHQRGALPTRVPGRLRLPRRAGGRTNRRPRPSVDNRIPGVPTSPCPPASTSF